VITLARILFWSAALFAFIMAALPQPPEVPGTPSDKVLHMLAFACLAALGSAAYPRLAAFKLVAALSAFGALIEFVQLIPELHRDAELLDWLADTGAVFAIVSAIHLWRRAQQKRTAG
jgi:VanZ family protein